MQKCSICEKPIYGHPLAKSQTRRVNGKTVSEVQPLVCGSCPLSKMQGGASGKSFFEVRIGMTKMVTKQIPEKQESVMSDLKVRSNVKNRTILLDGRFPLVFDAEGFGKMPAHLLPLLEREMTMKPGRFSVVSEEAPVAPVPVEVPVEAPPAKVEEEKVEEAVPAGLDQNFLAEEPSEPVKKASKKK